MSTWINVDDVNRLKLTLWDSLWYKKGLNNQVSFLGSEMKTRVLALLLILVLCLLPRVALCKDPADVQAVLAKLVKKIPARQNPAMTGSEFATYVSDMDTSGREQAIETQLTEGNLPEFLKTLKPVQLTQKLGDGKTKSATIFAMPDYLSVGSDRDYLLTPMNLRTAINTALKFGFVLPTKKIVDAIFKQSDVRCSPEPMPAGPQMRSTAYYVKHSQKIKAQFAALSCAPGSLVSGHKKDVVLTNRLIRSNGKIAIYGWHRPSGVPIQPLSTVHGANYADYSHGIRLISDIVLIDDEFRSMYDVLEDPRLAGVVSDEGAMPGVRQFMTREHEQPVQRTHLSARH